MMTDTITTTETKPDTTRKVTFVLGYGDTAVVRCEVRGLSITTGNSGSGQPNVHHYEVDIAGHTVHGGWYGDARHNITVHMEESHPLVPALLKISKSQRAMSDLRSAIDDPKWRDLVEDIREHQRDYAAAVKVDPVCQQILALARNRKPA